MQSFPSKSWRMHMGYDHRKQEVHVLIRYIQRTSNVKATLNPPVPC